MIDPRQKQVLDKEIEKKKEEKNSLFPFKISRPATRYRLMANGQLVKEIKGEQLEQGIDELQKMRDAGQIQTFDVETIPDENSKPFLQKVLDGELLE